MPSESTDRIRRPRSPHPSPRRRRPGCFAGGRRPGRFAGRRRPGRFAGVRRSAAVAAAVWLLAAAWLPGRPVAGAAEGRSTGGDQGSRPHIVMLVAEREYETDVTLPRFAREHLADAYETTFVFADPEDRDRLEGLGAIETADLLIVSVRRRTLPAAQLGQIRDYVAAGKPVIGIRTASHAFSVRGTPVGQGRAVWPEWDHQVFGGNYTNHHGNSLRVTVSVEPGSRDSPLLSGVTGRAPFPSGGSLYKVRPLRGSTAVLLWGSVEGQPAEPVAWTFRRGDGGKSFYTSLGHVEDFSGEAFPRLLENAIRWALDPAADR